MGYITKIRCDQCGAEDTVPQPGATPPGWILTKTLVPGAQTPQANAFCGWSHASLYAQMQAAQQAAEQFSARENATAVLTPQR